MSDAQISWPDLNGFVEYYRSTTSMFIGYPTTSNIDWSWMTEDWLIQDISRQTGFGVMKIKEDLKEWRDERDN